MAPGLIAGASPASQSPGGVQPMAEQDMVIPGSHQLALLSTGILPAGGGDRAHSLPRVTSPKRKGNTLLAALHAGLAQGGRGPGEANVPAMFAGPKMFSLHPS